MIDSQLILFYHLFELLKKEVKIKKTSKNKNKKYDKKGEKMERKCVTI